MIDDVLGECVASPDDDGPRLVWADRVGGERGELVVLQCDLARGGLSGAELAQRRKRERELLEAHGIEWAGAIAQSATRWSFRRGFIESARFAPGWFQPPHIADHPLVSTVAIDTKDIAMLGRIIEHVRPLRGLALQGVFNNERTFDGLAAWPRAGELRALAIDTLMDAAASLRTLLERAPLEQLWLHSHGLVDAELATLFAAAPNVTSLVAPPMVGEPALRFTRPLRALCTGIVNPKQLLQTSGHTLEHLRCAFTAAGRNAHWLAQFSKLSTLEVTGDAASEIVDAIVRTPGFDALRTLRIRSSLRDAQARALAERFGTQVDIQTADQFERGFDVPLLHPAPLSLLATAKPCNALTRPACIAKLDGDREIWDLPPIPVEDRVTIGRSSHVSILIRSSTVARMHGAIVGCPRGHEIHDYQSTNGITVNGQRIETTAELPDGAVISIADVRLRYFVGPDARERATAAISESSSS